MEHFAAMVKMIWDWIAEDPRTVQHSTPASGEGLVLYRSFYYIGFESGYLDFCRHIPRKYV